MFGETIRPGAPPPGRRAGPPVAGPRGGGYAGRPAPAGGGEPPAAWTTSLELYDSWHSALELGVKAELYRTGLTLKFSKVLAGKVGEGYENARGEQRYNRDAQQMAFVRPEQAVLLLELLDSLLSGRIGTAIVPLSRDEGKRIVLNRCEDYYAEGDAWYEDLRGSLVLSLESDGSGGERPTDPVTIVFFSRPAEHVLDDEAGPVLLYPELMAVRAFVASYLGGIARLDYASTRLLPAGPRQGGEVSAGPTRRSAAAAPAEGGGHAPPARGLGPAPSGGPERRGPADVSSQDIGEALAGDQAAF